MLTLTTVSAVPAICTGVLMIVYCGCMGRWSSRSCACICIGRLAQCCKQATGRSTPLALTSRIALLSVIVATMRRPKNMLRVGAPICGPGGTMEAQGRFEGRVGRSAGGMWGENEGGTKWRCVSKQQGQRQPAACPARCRAVHHRSPARAPHLSRGPLLPRGAPARKSGVPDGLVPVPRTPLPPASLDHSSWERACQVACWIAKLAPTQMTEAVAASAAQSPPLHVSNCCAQSVPSMGSDRGSSSVMLKERKRYCRGGGGGYRGGWAGGSCGAHFAGPLQGQHTGRPRAHTQVPDPPRCTLGPPPRVCAPAAAGW